MTVIVLGGTAPDDAERYRAILASIEFNPTRFRDLADEDVSFARDFVHDCLLRITTAIARLDHTDDEREAAISRALQTHHETLERRSQLTLLKLQAGQQCTLRDFAAWWVCECAIKNQLECELERRASPMH